MSKNLCAQCQSRPWASLCEACEQHLCSITSHASNWDGVSDCDCPRCQGRSCCPAGCTCSGCFAKAVREQHNASVCSSCGGTGTRRIEHISVFSELDVEPCPDCIDHLPF